MICPTSHIRGNSTVVFKWDMFEICMHIMFNFICYLQWWEKRFPQTSGVPYISDEKEQMLPERGPLVQKAIWTYFQELLHS